MKLLDALGRVVVALSLWIITAFVLGVIARPVWEALKLGFNIWG